MTRYLLVTTAILSLAACSAGENAAQYEIAEELSMDDAGETPAEPLAAKQRNAEAGTGASTAGEPETGEIPVSKLQIAYSYDYGFRLPARAIPKTQQTHISLCNSIPANGCRVLNMSNSGGEGDYAAGMLHLQVAAPKAHQFGEQLAEAVGKSGGSQIASSISGEDLSKQIVDTKARLRSRVILSRRLTELLKTRKGTVAELVEAERAVTQVNEEIDQARSWLKEMRGRVAYSKVMVNYQSGAPGSGGFTRPIREAFAGIASILGISVGAVITLTAVLLPWILALALAIYLRRRFKAADRTFWGRQIVENAPKDD